MRFGWYYIRDSFGATHDDVWSAVEEAVTKGAERGRLEDVRVGEMRQIDFDALLSVEDIEEHVLNCEDNEGRADEMSLLQAANDAMGDIVFDGEAHYRCSNDGAKAAVARILAEHRDDAPRVLAVHLHEWLKASVVFDPERVCNGSPPLPIELVDGEWRYWERGADYERETEAVITYATEPSPETGHVGWCWWAVGKMGDANTLREAMQAAEAVVADAERAERQRRAEEGRESKPEPYGSVVGEWAVPPVREPEKPGTVKHTTVGGVGCVGRLRRA